MNKFKKIPIRSETNGFRRIGFFFEVSYRARGDSYMKLRICHFEKFRNAYLKKS
jgi:hypothetical protein